MLLLKHHRRDALMIVLGAAIALGGVWLLQPDPLSAQSRDDIKEVRDRDAVGVYMLPADQLEATKALRKGDVRVGATQENYLVLIPMPAESPLARQPSAAKK